MLRSLLVMVMMLASLTGSKGLADEQFKPGSTFRDCPACPEMVVLPGDGFMMGSTRGRYDERSVIEVSWHDAKTYVAWLNSKLPGKPYQILSEAEWEYAARAGTTTQYHWGDEFDGSKANNRNNMVPTGQYAPNGFGLYDMHGNALEWVQDCYRESYDGAPTDGRPVADTPGCPRVLRSGAWSYGARVLHAGNRYATAPVDRMNIVGFRIARTL